MPIFAYDVHACTDCSAILATGDATCFSYAAPRDGGRHRLVCEHIKRRETLERRAAEASARSAEI
jgi:hypothetical protein